MGHTIRFGTHDRGSDGHGLGHQVVDRSPELS